MDKTHLEFSLYPNLFPIEVHVCYSADDTRCFDYFKKMAKESKLQIDAKKGDASTWRYRKHIFIEIHSDMGREPSLLAAMVAHEAVHASWFAEQIVGNMFNEDAQETQCYFVQYLTEQITRNIWNHIRKKSKKKHARR